MDWRDLPKELLCLVVSKLFPKDRKTFCLVCRSWNAVAINSPWLMFYQRSKRAWNFLQFSSDTVSNVVDREFPELHNAEIRCSKYGWLLMSRDDLTLFFFDPSNGTMIDLPKMDYIYTMVTFFHPPTSPHWFIFAIVDSERSFTILYIGMLKRGEDKWTSYPFDDKFPFFVSIRTPILHRGYLYCLDVNGNIGKYNIKGQISQRSSWMVYSKCFSPPRPCCIIKQHFLFKIRGKKMIFAVFVEHDEGKVNVFRLLEPEMKWELVDDLGDKMLFVSHFATFAEIAPNKSMANRIYFPKFHGDKGVFYSLNTKKYHSIDGSYTSVSSHGFKELRFATWYVPLPVLESGKLHFWYPNATCTFF